MPSQNPRGRPRIRVAVALCQDGNLLLVQHSKGGQKYWLLPGGGLEWGEPARRAAFRELLEETGIEAEIGHLLLASETVSPDGSRHLLHLVFSARAVAAPAQAREKDERITDVAWVPLGQVADLTFHPPIGAVLAALGPEGLRFQAEDSIFLGNLWVD